MIRFLIVCLFLLVMSLGACSDFSNRDAERVLEGEKVYPLTVEIKMLCNSDITVREVIEKNLVEDGFVTARLQHNKADVGDALIQFTNQAQSYLLPTDDTLKSFHIQRVKVADEILSGIRNVEISASGDKAVVDYNTEYANQTPFIRLYKQEVEGENKRRTFFTRKDKTWTWDGKIIRMPR